MSNDNESRKQYEAELEALSRKAVACRHFQWLPGMASLQTKDNRPHSRLVFQSRRRVLDAPIIDTKKMPPEYDGDRSGPKVFLLTSCTCPHLPMIDEPEGLFPDLSDPGTVGCLYAVVREAWGRLDLSCVWVAEKKWVVRLDEFKKFEGTSEVAALVAALEAAP